jgi:hypothetical protein
VLVLEAKLGSGLNMGPQNGSETGLPLNVINALITLPIQTPTATCPPPTTTSPPTTTCRLPPLPATSRDHLLSIRITPENFEVLEESDKLSPPLPATSHHYPHHYLLPPTTTCYLPPLPATSHHYLLPPTTTCYLPPLPAASHHYLLPPITTCCHLDAKRTPR